MNSRAAPTKAIPALPPNFEANFLEGGWRMVERVYGCRDDVILAWMAQLGGVEQLQARRREHQQERVAIAEAAMRTKPRNAA